MQSAPLGSLVQGLKPIRVERRDQTREALERSKIAGDLLPSRPQTDSSLPQTDVSVTQKRVGER